MDGQGVLNTSPIIRGAVRQPPSYPSYVVPGVEMCRSELLGNGGYVFATTTPLLLRSDLIRERPGFFTETHLHADHEACFEGLEAPEFGFCQQGLSCTRM